MRTSREERLSKLEGILAFPHKPNFIYIRV